MSRPIRLTVEVRGHAFVCDYTPATQDTRYEPGDPPEAVVVDGPPWWGALTRRWDEETVWTWHDQLVTACDLEHCRETDEAAIAAYEDRESERALERWEP